MHSLASRLSAFSSREEVPRSIGLLLVLVYVVALAALGLVSDNQIRAVVWEQQVAGKTGSIVLLANMLDPGTETEEPARQATLRRYMKSEGCAEVRVYDRNLQIVASPASSEVGRKVGVRPPGSQVTPAEPAAELLSNPQNARRHLLLRAPVPGSGKPPNLFVEAVFDLEPPRTLISGARARMLAIALVSTGALLWVYHMLRRHFRSFAKIANNLAVHRGRVEQQLDELRVQDGNDALTSSWNRLIDEVAALEEEVARSTAANELLSALSKTKAGELAEAMISVPLGVLLLAEDCTILYANRVAGRLVGCPEGSDSGAVLGGESATRRSDQTVEVIRACVLETSAFRPFDKQIDAGDGNYYHARIIPVRTQQQSRRFVALIADVSQQVRADTAREEFVSQVTHELRTPLTNIRAYAETLSSGMFDDPQVITECYNVITKETRRLSRLIEDILSISQLEVGSMQLIFDDVDLRSLLTDAVRDVRGIAESKNIDLQIVLPPKLEPIRADRDKLAVVINNLLGNALKYTHSGGQVVLSCRRTENNLIVSIRDSGIGIDPKDHERIFEKFQRSSDPEVLEETGTGIGLTTAREIVRHHGGEISLMSKKGEGSTFTVTIPVDQRAPTPAVART